MPLVRPWSCKTSGNVVDMSGVPVLDLFRYRVSTPGTKLCAEAIGFLADPARELSCETALLGHSTPGLGASFFAYEATIGCELIAGTGILTKECLALPVDVIGER